MSVVLPTHLGPSAFCGVSVAVVKGLPTRWGPSAPAAASVSGISSVGLVGLFASIVLSCVCRRPGSTVPWQSGVSAAATCRSLVDGAGKFRTLQFLRCLRGKAASASLCTSPFTHLSYDWRKQSFCVFGTGVDMPSAALETAKNVLSYPSRHILSQHPHSHPSEWVARGHGGRQNRQHSKKGRQVHKASHSAAYKPHGVGTQRRFLRLKIEEKPQNIHDFRSKIRGGGVIFWTPPHLPQNLKKWVSNEGVTGGGVRTKYSSAGAFIGQNNELQGVKVKIQPLRVGYASRPKKTQNAGGMLRFPPHAPAWL